MAGEVVLLQSIEDLSVGNEAKRRPALGRNESQTSTRYLEAQFHNSWCQVTAMRDGLMRA
jgi:hypothetical protein